MRSHRIVHGGRQRVKQPHSSLLCTSVHDIRSSKGGCRRSAGSTSASIYRDVRSLEPLSKAARFRLAALLKALGLSNEDQIAKAHMALAATEVKVEPKLPKLTKVQVMANFDRLTKLLATLEEGA